MTLFLIAGIVSNSYYEIGLACGLTILVILMTAVLFLNIWLKKTLFISTIPDILFGLSWMLTGNLITQIHDHRSHENHYTKRIVQNGEFSRFKVSIDSKLRSSDYHDKYLVSVHQVDNKAAFGRALLLIKLDSSCASFQVDDHFLIAVHPQSIPGPKNPHQFDYQAYMHRQQVYTQIEVSASELFPIPGSKSLRGRAARFRNRIINELSDFDFSLDAQSIIQALLLGEKSDISSNLRDDYARAGAIHILAISGLHVGIVLLIFQRILKPFNWIPYGRHVKIVFLLLILWSYALLAGLSPSVTRAVSMFSVFAVALNLKLQTNVFNNLFISAFLLLLCRPNFLFDVGFQLSYCALSGILIVEPKLRSLWNPKYSILRFYWRILTMSCAAQIGVLPLSLFYFHQFPGLFFVSNLVILPLLGIILGLGIGMIALALFNMLPTWYASAYGNMIDHLNAFIGWVARQEAFISENISFGFNEILLYYLTLSFFLIYMERKNYRNLIRILLLISCFQLFSIISMYPVKQRMVVFHKSRFTILAFQHHRQLIVHHNIPGEDLRSTNPLKDYIIGEKIEKIKSGELLNHYKIREKTLLVIDSSGIYELDGINPDWILLRDSPRINLNRLIDLFNPELIISDGSNFRSFQDRWETSCIQRKIPFQRTAEKGAFIYSYK